MPYKKSICKNLILLKLKFKGFPTLRALGLYALCQAVAVEHVTTIEHVYSIFAHTF